MAQTLILATYLVAEHRAGRSLLLEIPRQIDLSMRRFVEARGAIKALRFRAVRVQLGPFGEPGGSP
ncbi:MAG: hypothetical protein HY269_02355 [Deltaproteobacteria bacterium]|nr:hypothetical protein [Deltaproteobacteria bacterium]